MGRFSCRLAAPVRSNPPSTKRLAGGHLTGPTLYPDVPQVPRVLCPSGLRRSRRRTFRAFRHQPPHVAIRIGLFPPDADLASRQGILGFASTRQARHDVRPNRVPLVRTTRSPPVALHAPSRSRSYLRLQGPDQTLARTSTSLLQRAPTRTGSRSARPAKPNRGRSRRRKSQEPISIPSG